jgi:hypothetical protein
MADNDQSKIRYDDFIGNIQPDPAKPEQTIMLSGFVGRGPEGHVRIYPDPTLGTWYDVPEADVIHSLPIADSKLGGSYLWLRASADIKPGSAAPEPAPVAQAQAAAAQPTPTVQTHCFICPPLTRPPQCPPDQTLATICTQLHCPTHPVVCDTLAPTPRTTCFICPPLTQDLACGQQNTAATLCTQVNCPTHPPVCTQLNCPTHPQLCTQVNCPTHPPICTQLNCPTHPPACPVLSVATVCTQVNCPTHPPICTQLNCPTHQPPCGIHPTTFTQPVGFCPPTQVVACPLLPPSIGCTQQGCAQGAPQPGGPVAQAFAAPAAPQAGGVFTFHICPTPSAVQMCGQPHPTLATVCTLPPACPPHTIHNSMCICPTPSAVGQCGHPTIATVCTMPAVCFPQQTGFVCVTPNVNTQACPFTPNGVFTPFGR